MFSRVVRSSPLSITQVTTLARKIPFGNAGQSPGTPYQATGPFGLRASLRSGALVCLRGILPLTPVGNSGPASQANCLLALSKLSARMLYGREQVPSTWDYVPCSLHTSLRSSERCVAHCIGGFAPCPTLNRLGLLGPLSLLSLPHFVRHPS